MRVLKAAITMGPLLAFAFVIGGAQADDRVSVFIDETRDPPFVQYTIEAVTTVEHVDGKLVATLVFENLLDWDLCFEPGWLPENGIDNGGDFQIRSGRRHFGFQGVHLETGRTGELLNPARRISAGETITEQIVLDDYYELPPEGTLLEISFLSFSFVCHTNSENVFEWVTAVIATNTVEITR